MVLWVCPSRSLPGQNPSNQNTSTMPATLQFDQSADIHVVRISGMLKKAELSNPEQQVAAAIDTGANPRILAIVQDFDGWEPGSDF